MERIHITEVSPRDGLQNQAVLLSTDKKLRLNRLLAAAGVSSIEVTSFVSPKAVPQLSDADSLMRSLALELPDVRLSALVPNLRGLERGVNAGVKEIAVVLAATESMNQRNINMGLAAAVETCKTTLAFAREGGLRTRAYIGVAFECPFEGPVPGKVISELAETMYRSGANEIVVADTTGAASPRAVRERLDRLSEIIPSEVLSVHFHDTRGMGLANAWAALEAGIRRLDSSVGGIGGCPFAPGAAGNLATEDLVLMAESCGFSTGIELDRLLEAIEFAASELGKNVGGRSYAWLQRRRMKAPHGSRPG